MILHRFLGKPDSRRPSRAVQWVVSTVVLLSCLWRAGVPSAWAQGNVPPAIQEISTLFQQGVDALNKRDYTKAEQAFMAAYNRAEAIGEKYSMGTMMDAVANVYLARGDTKQARHQTGDYPEDSGH
jgi:outer membrane protein assembly factor BamD (BamD/ComL family)